MRADIFPSSGEGAGLGLLGALAVSKVLVRSRVFRGSVTAPMSEW